MRNFLQPEALSITAKPIRVREPMRGLRQVEALSLDAAVTSPIVIQCRAGRFFLEYDRLPTQAELMDMVSAGRYTLGTA